MIPLLPEFTLLPPKGGAAQPAEGPHGPAAGRDFAGLLDAAALPLPPSLSGLPLPVQPARPSPAPTAAPQGMQPALVLPDDPARSPFAALALPEAALPDAAPATLPVPEGSGLVPVPLPDLPSGKILPEPGAQLPPAPRAAQPVSPALALPVEGATGPASPAPVLSLHSAPVEGALSGPRQPALAADLPVAVLPAETGVKRTAAPVIEPSPAPPPSGAASDGDLPGKAAPAMAGEPGAGRVAASPVALPAAEEPTATRDREPAEPAAPAGIAPAASGPAPAAIPVPLPPPLPLVPAPAVAPPTAGRLQIGAARLVRSEDAPLPARVELPADPAGPDGSADRAPQPASPVIAASAPAGPELAVPAAPSVSASPVPPGVATPPPPPSQAAAPAPALDRVPEQRDHAAQIESTIAQVGTLREALRSARPEMTLRHAEFGTVSVQIEAAAPDQWRAVLASRDPGFVPAIQAALAERSVAAGENAAFAGQNGTGQHGPADQRYGTSPSAGQGSSQPYLGIRVRETARPRTTTAAPRQRPLSRPAAAGMTRRPVAQPRAMATFSPDRTKHDRELTVHGQGRW